MDHAFANDENRLLRFQQEARTVGALNHPNILSVHDIGAHNGVHYMVTELLNGETLRQKVAKEALPPRRATEYAMQIAHGLASAHERGVVHRDLKPENIFVTADGTQHVASDLPGCNQGCDEHESCVFAQSLDGWPGSDLHGDRWVVYHRNSYGAVTFKSGSTFLGAITLSSGSASLTTSSLASGSHTITATYNRSGSFATSSPTLIQRVN